MKVADAKRVARSWVDEVASQLPGFQGAFFHGSINSMSDDDVFPLTSDVDVGVVFAESQRLPKLGKTLRDGIIVEGAVISSDRLATAERLLGDYRLGHSFRTDSAITDPTGHLRRVQPQVAQHFADRHWVLERCEDAKRNCLTYVNRLDESIPYSTQAICWLFAEGNLTHILLAAGLRNPTVRRRYSAVRELLASAGRPDVHETLLTMLGCATMPRSPVEHHLDRMARAFDLAASVIRSDFPFGSDISELARRVAVDGSRDLIERGEHREAVFWIAATLARCMAVLDADGSRDVIEEVEPGLRGLMEDLGVGALDNMRERTAEIETFLPDLMTLAGELIGYE